MKVGIKTAAYILFIAHVTGPGWSEHYAVLARDAASPAVLAVRTVAPALLAAHPLTSVGVPRNITSLALLPPATDKSQRCEGRGECRA